MNVAFKDCILTKQLLDERITFEYSDEEHCL